MKRFGNLLTALAAIVFVISSSAAIAEAQRKNERQIRDQVRSLNAQIDDFQFGLDHQLRTSSLSAEDVEDVQESIRNLQTKVDDLDENLSNKRDNRDDIREIIAAANSVDAFLARNPQNRRIETNWQNIRKSINDLSSNYGVTPDWGNSIGTSTSTRVTIIPPVTPRRNSGTNSSTKTPPQITTLSYGLTGTYSLDVARSEKIADIISVSGVDSAQRSELASKLEAPDQIAIDIRGSEVTLASSKAPPVTFYADGREKMEESNGRSVSVRATMRGEELTIASVGGETDYVVSFMPMVNGRGLRVTRRITTDYLKETIFAESFYNKTDASAGLGIERTSNTGSYPRPDRNTNTRTDPDQDSSSDSTISTNDTQTTTDSGSSQDSSSSDSGTYSSNDSNNGGYTSTGPTPSVSQAPTGNSIVPNGTMITGLLESVIDTKVTRNNDRFRMVVQSPNEFRGAVIDGYVTGVDRSGRVSGRSNLTFNFESITLRNGQRYDFSGYLHSVRDANGRTLRVDGEGSISGGSQTSQTVKRGGIGAGIGAIIGAIAGGGTGAAIGAIIGGGAGAGSVIVQGRNDLRLTKGTMITVQSSSRRGNTRVGK